MSVPRPPQAVKLVLSLIFREKEAGAAALGKIQQKYGPVDFVSASLPFNFTDYYAPEMGESLRRRMASLAPLISPERLAEVKLWTNQLETQDLNERNGRKVNIDPGYLAASKFILATGKDYGHRIYLGEGIYGDLTLIFQKGSFCALPWTYPDYASPPLIRLLNLIRKRYVWQLRNPEGRVQTKNSSMLNETNDEVTLSAGSEKLKKEL